MRHTFRSSGLQNASIDAYDIAMSRNGHFVVLVVPRRSRWSRRLQKDAARGRAGGSRRFVAAGRRLIMLPSGADAPAIGC
jgi:hypothetical protein